MERRIVQPHELDFDTRGRRDYWVALGHDSIWGDHLVPLTVFVGPKAAAGRGLVAFGANHGNEYEGPIAITHLIREIDPADVLGRIILVPMLNVAAFRAGTRDSSLDDGVNLNRAFVDGAGRTPALAGITHRIADFVRSAIWPLVHVVIDLHAGGEVARFVRFTSIHDAADPEQARETEETARWFGAPFVSVYSNLTPGLLPSEADRIGKITVGGEFGWGQSVQAEGVRYARHGVRMAAIRHGQLAGRLEKFGHHAAGTQRIVEKNHRACITVAPFAGHYESLLECGEAVRAGDAVGLLHDFDRPELEPWPCRAGVDGFVTGQAWGARVAQGQHIVVVARPRVWRADRARD